MAAPLFLSPRELRRETPSAPAWVWDGYVARGAITLLAGLPKAGKSTLACALVEAVRSGAPSFLGRKVTGGGAVVLTEEPAVTALAKFADSDNVRLLVREHAWPQPAWPEVVALSVAEASRVGAHLLVVDSLAFWGQFGSEAENDAGTVTRAFAPLFAAAAEGLAVLLPVHQRKSGGEGGTAIRGSGAIAANADLLMELERVDRAPANHRQLLAVGRWAAPPLLVVARHADGAWSVIGEAANREDAADASWRAQLLALLSSADPGLSADEIGQQLGTDRRKFSPALKAVVAEQLISVSGAGKRGDPFRYRRSDLSLLGSPPVLRERWEGNGPDHFPPFPLREEGDESSPGNKASPSRREGNGAVTSLTTPPPPEDR